MKINIFEIFKIIGIWKMRVKNRRKLIGFSDYLLDDIGINREEAMKEYRTPFWKKRIF